jgi:hypothetical protein
MKPGVMIAAIVLAAGCSAAQAASAVPSVGPGDAVEPNRLTANPKSRAVVTGRR